jgi:sec-independent protein translocase protein TatA
MFGIGWPEVIVISAVAVAIFGVKKIPELGRAIGKTISGFREEIKAEPEQENNE